MATADQPGEWQYYVNPWWRERRTYVSQFGLDKCAELLREVPASVVSSGIRRTLLSPTRFTFAAGSLFMRNDARPYAYVNLADFGSGRTYVDLTLSSSRWSRGFMVFWYAFLALWTGLAVSGAFASQGRSLAPLGALALFVSLFLAFPILLTLIGRGIASSHRRRLREFLVARLELVEAPVARTP
jgi:hypothetical protein